MTPPQDPQNRLDQAIADRLAKLRTLPVDTSRLDARLAAAIPRPRATVFRRLLRPITTVAASLLLVGTIAAVVLMNGSGSAVLASPARMAQVHRDIVSNKLAVTHVSSIEEAGAVLSKETDAHAPALPKPPEAHVMACCMKSIDNKKMACVLLEGAGGVPITMSVAKASDMKVPPGTAVTQSGEQYHVHSADGLNMVMCQRSGRMVCLISELPSDQLIELAKQLKF